jgi:peptide/nickel transport system permease protein
MSRYLLKRSAISILIFFALTFFVFTLSSLAPGSPVDSYITPQSTPEDIAHMESYLGLDDPVPVRYAKWLGRMLTGDLGNSYRAKMPVQGLIADALGPTIVLTGTALLVALLAAVPLGVLSAVKPYSFWDRAANVMAYVGAAVPRFFVGLVVVFIFAVQLKVLPATGLYSAAGDGNLLDRMQHLILPVFVVAFGIFGVFVRQMRSSMLEVWNEEYVKLARAKGLAEWRVISGFVLRNALIPVVTTVGLAIPALLSGTVVAEQLFALPGIGKLLLQAVTGRDYPVVMGVAMFLSVVVLAVNLLLDIIYGLLDPRIRLAKAKA